MPTGTGDALSVARCLHLGDQFWILVIENVEDGHTGIGICHHRQIILYTEINRCAGGVCRTNDAGLGDEPAQWIGALRHFRAVIDAIIIGVCFGRVGAID